MTSKNQFIRLVVINIIFCLLFTADVFCKDRVLRADLDGKGVKEQITLLKVPVKELSHVGTIANGYLQIESKGEFFSKDIGILEFSNDSEMKLIKIGHGLKSFIAIFAPGGMHGLTLSLYSFDGNEIKEEITLYSNAPLIEVKDSDNDGVKDIVVWNRDYEKDPIHDMYVKIYKYKNGVWVCDSNLQAKLK